MAKYRITLSAEIELEAPNVVQADKIARSKVRVAGEHYGLVGGKNDRDLQKRSIVVLGMALSKPQRTYPPNAVLSGAATKTTTESGASPRPPRTRG